MAGKTNMKVDNGAYGTSSIEMEFPGNTKKDRQKREESQKTVNKVIKGSVVQKKKPLSKRMCETFLGDDINNVTQYVIHDVIIPAAKSTISEMVSGGIEMLLFGDTKGSKTRRDKGKSYVSYSSFSKPDRRDDRRPARNNRASHNFDDIVLESRGEAEEVLSHLVDLIEDYGMASVADLYELVGIKANFTDGKYGWTNLSHASVSRIRDGYLIDLPKTVVID